MKIVRWLYHVLRRRCGARRRFLCATESSCKTGSCTASFRDEVVTSARLYFPAASALRVLQIDPRRLGAGCEVRVVATPRGPMPHVHGPIPRAAIVGERTLDQMREAPDELVPDDPADDASG